MTRGSALKENRAFNKAYTALNDAQKDAVDTIEGPVMVIAGPGTGKTQILTLRIATILQQTDVQPDNILALTFTESGAKAMRERLLQYVGAAAYRVQIATFHSFCQKQIAQYPDAYPTIVGGQPATDIDRIEVIEAVLEDPAVATLRPSGNPEYYVKPLLSTISDLKRENISPTRLRELVTEQENALKDIPQYHETGAHRGKERGAYKEAVKNIEKNRALAHVYTVYEAALRERRRFDFDDMILETVRALESSEDMLRDLQEQYQYLLADEHQDVNGAQNRILELLASYHDQPNIFVVGDEKQAIFRFQGASLQNFLHFESYFAGTKVISLTDNYRSGQPILDAAQHLIATDDEDLAALRIPLQAAAVTTATVTRRIFSHQAVEDSWVVAEVQRQIDAGVPPQEIAVIVRSNREVEDTSVRLRQADIPAQASAEGDILYHPVTHTVEQLLRAAVTADEAALCSVLHGSYWGLITSDVTRICAARAHRRALHTIVRDETVLAELGVRDVPAVTEMVRVLDAARAASSIQAPHEVLAYLVEASGYKEYLLTQQSYEGARILRRVYDEIEELVKRDRKTSVSGVLDVFAQRRAYGLPLTAPFIGSQLAAVQVMTAHKSKGLEFQVVFAPHLTDNAWGGTTKRTLFKIPQQSPLEHDAADDEKRLLYVLMTRAKQTLYLSSSELNADGRPLSPTRLLADIDETVLPVHATDTEEATFDPLDHIAVHAKDVRVDVELVATLFAERGFSATSFNNYLRSPWEYYFKNLVRVPEVQPPHMQFGTAVHAVLQRVTAEHTKHGAVPTDAQILTWLEEALLRLPLTATEYARQHEKAMTALLQYVAAIAPTLPARTKEELSITVALPPRAPEHPPIVLKGTLDRLDFDEAGQVVRVVDYKTGKAKSRNVIEGKTQAADGAYKRQLVFYALLLELYDDERYRCRTGVLSFVESATAGALKEELFTVTDEEIAELTEELYAAAEALQSGSWVDIPCDPAEVAYCHFVQ